MWDLSIELILLVVIICIGILVIMGVLLYRRWKVKHFKSEIKLKKKEGENLSKIKMKKDTLEKQDEKEALPLEPIPIIKAEEESEDKSKEKVKKRYCTNCGKLLEPNWKICPYCGVKVWKDMWKDNLTLEDEKMLMEKKAISQPEPSPSGMIKSKTKDEEPVESIEPSSSIEIRDKKLNQDGLVQSQIEKRDIPKPMKNLCPFCGYENELNKAYCHQCGYKLIK